MTQSMARCNDLHSVPSARHAALRYTTRQALATANRVLKIRIETIISAGLAEVWRAFDDPDNLGRWQPTLASCTHKFGKPGQPDAVTELQYNENGKQVTITETITERRQPVFLAATYDSAWGKTLTVNHFEAIDDSTTRWVVYSNIAFKGFMKLASVFVAGSIQKRNDADMQRFKHYVENTRVGNS